MTESKNIEVIQDGAIKELDRVRALAQIELDWWKDNIISDPVKALAKGDLVEVPTEGESYGMIRALREDDEPRFLNPQALNMLNVIQIEWSKRIKASGLQPDVVLSISSLYRSEELQQKLINQGENAAEVSSHQAGAAIDFDPTGYYKGKERKPVSSRLDNGYDPKYTEILRDILQELHEQGRINFIHEYKIENINGEVGKRLACYHVCVSPDF